jgi:hypothetical protein
VNAGTALIGALAEPLLVLLAREDIRAALARAVGPTPAAADGRATWTTPKNAPALFGGKTFRALDEWARRLRLPRFAIAGSPAYRTSDLDAAIEATRDASPAVPDRRDDFANVVDIARQGRKAASR